MPRITVQASLDARVYLIDMGKLTRPVGSGSSLRATHRRRYQLLLLGTGADRGELVSDHSLDLGDHVLVDDAPYEVIGLIWNEGTADEAFLCRRIAAKAAPTRDEPTTRERTWWSTRWHA